MIRGRIAYAALLAFPPDVRAARGAEMVGTLLDVFVACVAAAHKRGPISSPV